jgi:hypothetical protein
LESENTCMTACARRRPSGREGTRAGSAAVAVSTARDGRDGRTDGRTTRGAGRDRVAPPSRDPPASWPPWCPRGPVSSLLEERRFFRLSGSRTRRGVPKPRASPSRSSRVRPRARDRALLAREQTGGPSRGDLRSRAARCVSTTSRAGAGTNDPRATGYSRDRRHRSIEATARSRSGVRSSGRVRARGGRARSAHNETRGIHRTPRHRTRGHRAGEPTPRERRARRGTRRRRTARAREIVEIEPARGRIGVAFGRDVEEATTGRRRVRARRAEEEEGAEGAHAGGGRGAQGASLRAGGSARRDRSLAPRLAPTRARVVFKTTRFNSIHHDRSSPPHRSSPA